jgi:hypothetical protein
MVREFLRKHPVGFSRRFPESIPSPPCNSMNTTYWKSVIYAGVADAPLKRTPVRFLQISFECEELDSQTDVW